MYFEKYTSECIACYISHNEYFIVQMKLSLWGNKV